jgi:hypothetical protein
MEIEELFSRLSFGELSNLSLGNEGRGSLKEEDIPKVMSHTNEGLLRIYSRFLLSAKQLLIEQVRHITNYHLIVKYAESSGSNADWLYIKDLPDEKFQGDVIRVLEVYDSVGREFVLNDTDDPQSLFTPAPQLLQVPDPKAGRSLGVQYQARHVNLEADDLSQEIIIPFVLEGALQAFVAYKILSHMNGQENQLKGQEYLATYEGICMDVEARDLVNTSFSTSHHKLEERGFV